MTTDILLDMFHANENKIEAYNEVLPLFHKVDDIEDLSQQWKELNNSILRPSLSLFSAPSMEYYNLHYKLFTKCNENSDTKHIITMQYDIFMNVLYSILYQIHTISFIIDNLHCYDYDSYDIYIPTDENDDEIKISNGDDENTIKIKLFYASMSILHKMLHSSFTTKIQYLSTENIDKFYIALFTILRCTTSNSGGVEMQPIHLLVIKDLCADWFILYAKQIPTYQLVQYLLHTQFIYDILHHVTQTSLHMYSIRTNSTDCIDLHQYNTMITKLESTSSEKVTLKDVEYKLFLHSISIFKTILISTQMKVLPLISANMKISITDNFETIVSSQEEARQLLFTKQYIQNELKPIKECENIRIFVINDNEKQKMPKWIMIKKIIVHPYLSTIKYQLLHTTTFRDYEYELLHIASNTSDNTKERLIDICCQPIQMLLSFYSDNKHILSLLYMLFRDIFLPIYLTTTAKRYHPQEVNYIILLIQSCADCISKLVTTSNISFSSRTLNIYHQDKTFHLLNLFYSFILSIATIATEEPGIFHRNSQCNIDLQEHPSLLNSQLKLWLSILSLLDSISYYIENVTLRTIMNASRPSPSFNPCNSSNYKKCIDVIKGDFNTFCDINHLKYEDQKLNK